jgi:hypothetical protein
VKDGALTVHGEAIGLIAENTDKINEAIGELRRAAAATKPSGGTRFDALDKRRQDMVKQFRTLAESEPAPEERGRLLRAIRGTVTELRRIEEAITKQ